MTFWEWFGLIGSILPIVAVGGVFRFDLVLYVLYLCRVRKFRTISQGVWLDLDRWRAGLGPYPKRLICLPVSVFLAGLVSSICLYIHLAAG
jgi:hypothetical protein